MFPPLLALQPRTALQLLQCVSRARFPHSRHVPPIVFLGTASTVSTAPCEHANHRHRMAARDHQSRYKAASYNASYQGAMFPWESAASGEETCPVWAGTGLREIHISGDIAVAVELMFEATGSTAWLASTGFPIVSQVAEMWCSRVVPSADDNLLHINDVIPPDEYVPSAVAHSCTACSL
jgi:hypothetical protein